MKKMLMDYIREESQCHYADLIDYFMELNQCGHELKAKYLGDLIFFIAQKEFEENQLTPEGIKTIEENVFYSSETTVELSRKDYEKLIKQVKDQVEVGSIEI